MTSWKFSFYKIITDEGIEGYGPYHVGTHDGLEFAKQKPSQAVLDFLKGFDPLRVYEFWERFMSGRRFGIDMIEVAGLEIAMWDIIGKMLKRPIYQLLGASDRDRITVYAATGRLLKPEEHVKQCTELLEKGFKAIKIRFHRPNPEDDLKVARAVKDVVGDSALLLVDANQNHPSITSYNFWSRRTALRVAKQLDKLEYYLLEDPLPLKDVEGLIQLRMSVETLNIGGGEHARTVWDLKDHIVRGAYDVIMQDLALGSIGIIGLRKVATLADYFGRQLIPHVLSGSGFPFSFTATLHAIIGLLNAPMIEYPYDPPILVPETQQYILREHLVVNKDGTVNVLQKPGLGIELRDDIKYSVTRLI